MKKEVARLQEEAKQKEVRHKAQVDRLRRQIDDLSIKNGELELEIQQLEALRPRGGGAATTTSTSVTVGQSQAKSTTAPRYNFSSGIAEDGGFIKTEMEDIKEQDSEEEDGQSARSGRRYE